MNGRQFVRGTKLPLLFAVIGLIAAATWLWDRYTFAVRWPSQVQQEVLGSIVVSSDVLVSKERSFAFGEGFARWRYKVDAKSTALRRFCQEAPPSHCAFKRTRNVAEGVDLSVTLSGETLTVEEWWG
jgi:hypothetical protein